jgi:hypothetical protein
MASRLTTIAAEIKELIEGITIAHGYDYDWGSVNEPDQAHVTYPCAEITYASEDGVPEQLGLYGFATAQFVIRLRCDLSELPTDHPFFAIDEELDIILRDVKKRLMRADTPADTLPITEETVIKYVRMEKETERQGDIFRPKSLLTYWTVAYQEDIES